MANIKSIINIHNKKVMTEKETQTLNCNCIYKPDCPLSNQGQTTNIIYKAKTASNLRNYHGKIYYGTRAGAFKQRYGNHKNSIIKNKGEIQHIRRNTGDLKNSKPKLKDNFIS